MVKAIDFCDLFSNYRIVMIISIIIRKKICYLIYLIACLKIKTMFQIKIRDYLSRLMIQKCLLDMRLFLRNKSTTLSMYVRSSILHRNWMHGIRRQPQNTSFYCIIKPVSQIYAGYISWYTQLIHKHVNLASGLFLKLWNRIALFV